MNSAVILENNSTQLPHGRRSLAGAVFLLATGLATVATAGSEPRDGERRLFDTLHTAAPTLDGKVLAMALRARACAARRGLATTSSRLAVIDYSMPSTSQRLWIFTLDQKPALLLNEYVAHGKGTGDNFARSFSNDDGSHQSSVGLFRTAETYVGGHGYSLRMDGLEQGFNDHARDRSIVIHGAWYVDPVLGQKQGRLGRSLGCPAVRQQVVRPVIESLKDGQLLFAYYPESRWLRSSSLLNCGGSSNTIAAVVR
jgi:hypothetical protein